MVLVDCTCLPVLLVLALAVCGPMPYFLGASLQRTLGSRAGSREKNLELAKRTSKGHDRLATHLIALCCLADFYAEGEEHVCAPL